jgi:inhibitor of cysteine peptidase
MKNKVLVTLALVGLLLTMAACSAATGAPGNTSINIPAADFDKQANIAREVEVSAGDTFTITLDSNATTGFQWTVQAKIANESVLNQIAHDYVAPNGKALGQAGTEQWTFKAVNAGTTTVNLSYDRTWEGGEKGVRTFELTAVVK